MGRWTDVAAWAGPIPNCGPGAMSAHMGVVIHTAEGSYAGTDSWQRNPAAEVGSHFLTAKDGRVEQLIDTDIRSWCQVAGNDAWISIENEGYGSRGESLSAGQQEACARILAKAHTVYGVPLQVSNSPSTPGLGWHGMGGAAWGGHYDCPGTAIKAQLPAIVARAAEIIGGDDMTPEQEAKLQTVLEVATRLEGALSGGHKAQQFGYEGGGTLGDIKQTVGQLATKPAAQVTMSPADQQAIADKVKADLQADLAPLIELAKRITG